MAQDLTLREHEIARSIAASSLRAAQAARDSIGDPTWVSVLIATRGPDGDQYALYGEAGDEDAGNAGSDTHVDDDDVASRVIAPAAMEALAQARREGADTGGKTLAVGIVLRTVQGTQACYRIGFAHEGEEGELAALHLRQDVLGSVAETIRAAEQERAQRQPDGAAQLPVPPPAPAPVPDQAAVSYPGPYCSKCGAAPVARVKFQQGIGMGFMRKTRTIAGPLCRDCGTAQYRETQNRTLWTGWWGIISFFGNFIYLFSNFREYGKVRNLPEPMATPASRITPQNRPASPGRPLLMRSGIWFTALVVAGVVVIVATHHEPPNPGDQVSVGQCLGGPETGTIFRNAPVVCSDPQATVQVIGILPVGSDPSGCPQETEHFTTNPDRVVLCLKDA
jgi:hypothetical protein